MYAVHLCVLLYYAFETMLPLATNQSCNDVTEATTDWKIKHVSRVTLFWVHPVVGCRRACYNRFDAIRHDCCYCTGVYNNTN